MRRGQLEPWTSPYGEGLRWLFQFINLSMFACPQSLEQCMWLKSAAEKVNVFEPESWHRLKPVVFAWNKIPIFSSLLPNLSSERLRLQRRRRHRRNETKAKLWKSFVFKNDRLVGNLRFLKNTVSNKFWASRCPRKCWWAALHRSWGLQVSDLYIGGFLVTT